LPFSHDASYASHRLSFGFGYEKSAILNDSSDSNSGASEPNDMGEPARPYRLGSFDFAYNVKNIQPYLFFPGQGFGAAVGYRYHRSLSGGEFSYHYFHLSSFKLQPLLGESLTLYLAADLQALSGRTPSQNRLGMSKYYTADGFMAFSDQIYIRGGDRYFPGNRLLTATMEMHCPLPMGLANMVVFLDMARIWENGLSAWNKGKGLASYGVEMQLPSPLGNSIGLGLARNVSEQQPGKWKFYLTIKNPLPF
jgi:outer membrane protein assembly factor BamA